MSKIKLEAKVKIVNLFTGSVLYESDKSTVKEALQDAVLQDAVLQGADLRGAVLRGAVLQGAVLQGADLQGAVLQGADLRGAVLRGAVLQGADLQDADLQDADLQDAVLQGADLRGAVLQGADLRGADLQDADLRGAVLRGAVLQGAVLQGADLRGAVLQGADLRGIPLDKLPKDFVNQCSRDILFILHCLKSEVPFLRDKLIRGEVDGSQYEEDCACLIGTLGNADGGVEQVCKAIPFYDKGTHNYGEMWFLNIRKGDTPKNSEFAKHVLNLIDMVLNEEV